MDSFNKNLNKVFKDTLDPENGLLNNLDCSLFRQNLLKFDDAFCVSYYLNSYYLTIFSILVAVISFLGIIPFYYSG